MPLSRRFRRLVAVVLPALFLLTGSPMARAMAPDLADRLTDALREPFTGDLDAVLERGFLRVLVPFSRTFYFIDGGTQRGTTVDMMREFGKFLVKRHGKAAGTDRSSSSPRRANACFPISRPGGGRLPWAILP